MDENTIDYGNWTCPTSWADITLKQLQDIQKLYSGDNQATKNIIDYIHILTNHSKEEVEALPYEFTERLLEEMSFLLTPLPEVKAKPEVIINGEKYAANVQEKMKTGEFVATQMALQSDSNNYAAILAIIARKEGEVYDSKFENEVLPERIKMFERAKAIDVLGIVSFFLQRYIVLEAPFQLASQVAEELDVLIAKNGEISRTGGVGNRLSTKWRMRKLKKLRKSLDGICKISSNS